MNSARRILVISIATVSALLAAAEAGRVSEKFEKHARWRVTDLRLLVFEMSELDSLRRGGVVLIDLTYMALVDAPPEQLAKLRIKQPAGKTIAEHLRALEEAMRFSFQGQHRMQFVSFDQMRVVDIAKLQTGEELAGVKTRPGDALIMRGSIFP